ncbi:hypothetical protein M3Y98_01012200 [Aphelenchoides besseyi]|nr:hypothetical protein M3Y98_01010700 [Aphelenchoides besseyi]KAI6172788.1 hypothetical protein M3Y98_01012200 [Aphelenchoides besseyi]KAI6210153.1 hypothetical protein M3Y96_00297600 [Aphelenchoides besseyi]
MSPSSIAIFFSLLVVSTHALPVGNSQGSPLLGNLVGNVLGTVNGVAGNAQPVIGEVTGLLGGCKQPGALTKIVKLLNLPGTVDPAQFVQLLSILTQLDSILTQITCTVDSLLPLEGGSGSGSGLDGLLEELRTILNIPSNVDLVPFLQRLLAAVEKLLDQLLGNVSGLLDQLLGDVTGLVGGVVDILNPVLNNLTGLLGIPEGVLPLDFIQQLIPQLQKVLDQLLGQLGSGLPVGL